MQLGISLVLTRLGSLTPQRYVSTTGNDGNAGTSASPWLTLDHAIGAAPDGANVVMRGGTYYTASQITKSGKRLNVSAYPGETPVLSGGVGVTGWVADTGSLQKVTGVTTTSRNLWVNGVRCNRARHTGNFTTAGTSSSGYTFAGNDNPVAAFARPQDLEIVGKWNNYTHGRLPVSAASASLLTMGAPAWANVSNWLALAAGSSNDYGRLINIKWRENSYEDMGNEGEFYLNAGTHVLYYTPRSGTKPAHTGTLNGSPAWTTDAPSQLSGQAKCLDFASGASKNVTTGYTPPLAQGARTFSAWVKSGSSGDIVSCGAAGTNTDFEIALTSATKIGLFISGRNIVYNCPSLNDGAWHHVAVAIPLGAFVNQVLFYVDGTLLTSVSSSVSAAGGLNTASGQLYIGNYHGGSAGFSGRICDVSVYERDLTPAEIATKAAGGTVTNQMYGNWKLNDGTGTSAADSWAGNGEDLSTATCVLGSLPTLLDLTGCTITFTGITFSHTSWALGSAGYIGQNPAYRVTAADASNNTSTLANMPAAVQVHGGTVTFSGCRFQNLGTAGVTFDTAAASGGVKEGCVFSDLSGPAVIIGGEVVSPFNTPEPSSPAVNAGQVVQDFYTCSCCQEYETGSPIALSYTASTTTIQHGEVAQCPYIGVGMNGLSITNNLTHGVVIANLLVHDTMTDSSMTDGAAMHFNGCTSLDGTASGGMSVTACATWACNTPPAGGPLYLDDITAGLSFTGNAMNDPDSNGASFCHFNDTGGGNNVVTGNTSANTTALGSHGSDVTSPNTLSTTPNTAIIQAAGISSAYQSVNRNVIDDPSTYPNGTDPTSRGWSLWGQGPFTCNGTQVSLSVDFGLLVKDCGNLTQTPSVTFTYSASARLPVVLLRGLDPNNFVWVGVKDSTHLGVWTNKAGVLSASLKTIAATLNTGTSYTLQAMALGTSIFVFLNGTYLDRLDGLDSYFNAAGFTYVGFGTVTGAGSGTCTWDNFTVTSP